MEWICTEYDCMLLWSLMCKSSVCNASSSFSLCPQSSWRPLWCSSKAGLHYPGCNPRVYGSCLHCQPNASRLDGLVPAAQRSPKTANTCDYPSPDAYCYQLQQAIQQLADIPMVSASEEMKLEMSWWRLGMYGHDRMYGCCGCDNMG